MRLAFGAAHIEFGRGVAGGQGIEHCARIGRNPAEIRTSVHVVYDPKVGFGAWVDKAREFEAAGVDLAIAYLPSPHRADVVAGLAEAIRGN
jgi:hypothetical protein